ncbi:cytokinin dehydrogenase [Kitasatospora sp. MAP12-15]|uniref:FAD-binding protein n=1 Tax=unclassified Kitasatospora TaxID=2633591 RepID=UPI002476E7E2|nr:FAD-binding protein [Kitasatospora sp. MAP12-44]MDH6109379.1 cytokinin dehydrogenase [Kitasatospora sp. MAP12-44]
MEKETRAQGTSRRALVRGAALGIAAVGFSAAAGTWVADADAAAAAPFDRVPHLDGELLLDAASRAADSVDQGHIVARTPGAVLRPGSVDDVAKMVRFCADRGIKVSARGQGHTTYGQSLNENGLVIEMRWLRQIHRVGPQGADVDGGVLWTELMTAAFAHGLTPPVFTGYTDLTIAGTLSVGGASPGAGSTRGLQIDHVQELEIVTGRGEVLVCSGSQHVDLFKAALGGLGQCGIIVRARLGLVPAQPAMRVYQFTYPVGTVPVGDLRILTERGETLGAYLSWALTGTSFVGRLFVSAPFTPGSPPDGQHLLRGLSQPPSAATVIDLSYPDWVTQVNREVAQLDAALDYEHLVKPWFDVWLGDSEVDRFVQDVLAGLSPHDFAPGSLLLLIPAKRTGVDHPAFRGPRADSTPWMYLFDILDNSATPGPDPAFTTDRLQRNAELYRKARDAGGSRYPIGALEFTKADWVAHYGDVWTEFQNTKTRFDPHNILNPGPGIF